MGGVLAASNVIAGHPLFPLNTLITIMGCQLVLTYVDRYQLLAKETFFLCLACVLFLLVSFPLMEYGTLGVLYALMGYAVRTQQMTWRTGKLVTLVALVMFLLAQMLVFPFDGVMTLFVVLGTSAVTWYLAHFVHKPLQVPARLQFVTSGIVFLSRHSLQYYVLHRMVMQALGVVMGVSKIGFRWF